MLAVEMSTMVQPFFPRAACLSCASARLAGEAGKLMAQIQKTGMKHLESISEPREILAIFLTQIVRASKCISQALTARCFHVHEHSNCCP